MRRSNDNSRFFTEFGRIGKEKGMAKTTQRDRVLQYIKEFGHITSYQAYSDLGITQLATRISELKDRGYMFTKERVKTKNRYGDKTHFDKYILIGRLAKEEVAE